MAAARRIEFTDRGLKALKPAQPTKPGQRNPRYIVWDAVAPHLGIRVTEKGAKSFVVVKRATGGKLTFTVLGQYPGVTLKVARKAVPETLRMLSEGKSPKQVKAEEAREAARRRADTLTVAVEQFIKWEEARKLRSSQETASTLRREFLGMVARRTNQGTVWSEGDDPVWRNRPVIEITRRDVIERLDQIKARGGKHAARHALGAVRKLFNWLVEGERFGLDESPAARIRDRTIGIAGRDLKRKRVLSDAELRDVWHAADALAYPFGRVVQMLMLTGQRLNDIAQARVSEIDYKAATLTVPPERYKTGEAHIVPLTSKAIEILAALPKFTRAYLFSTTAGGRPVGGNSKAKSRLDKVIAERRKVVGQDAMPHWVLHDLRRTVRTRLGDLGVDAFIAERVLGHALPGLHGVYDQGTHAEQKRTALEKWETLLLSIVEPPPEESGKVVSMRRRRQ